MHGNVISVRSVSHLAWPRADRASPGISGELLSVKDWLDVFALPVRWQEAGLPSAWNLTSFSTFKRSVERLDVRTFELLFGSTDAPLLLQMEHLYTVEHRSSW